jgi:hypothetical protein
MFWDSMRYLFIIFVMHYTDKGIISCNFDFYSCFYMSQAVMYLQSVWSSRYWQSNLQCNLFRSRWKCNKLHYIKDNSQIRLDLTTSIAGMGFDLENITKVIHTCPPHSMSQYLQEVGRAGRRGQWAQAPLYFRNSGISKNLPGIVDIISQTRCCLYLDLRKTLVFLELTVVLTAIYMANV